MNINFISKISDKEFEINSVTNRICVKCKNFIFVFEIEFKLQMEHNKYK